MNASSATSFVFALIFSLSALAKIRRPASSIRWLSEIFSIFWARLLFALGLGLEAGLAGCFFFEAPIGIWVSSIFLTTLLFFSCLLYLAHAKGLKDSCPCYGGWIKLKPTQGIQLNFAYAFMLILAFVLDGYWPKAEESLNPKALALALLFFFWGWIKSLRLKAF